MQGKKFRHSIAPKHEHFSYHRRKVLTWGVLARTGKNVFACGFFFWGQYLLQEPFSWVAFFQGLTGGFRDHGGGLRFVYAGATRPRVENPISGRANGRTPAFLLFSRGQFPTPGGEGKTALVACAAAPKRENLSRISADEKPVFDRNLGRRRKNSFHWPGANHLPGSSRFHQVGGRPPRQSVGRFWPPSKNFGPVATTGYPGSRANFLGHSPQSLYPIFSFERTAASSFPARANVVTFPFRLTFNFARDQLHRVLRGT